MAIGAGKTRLAQGFAVTVLVVLASLVAAGVALGQGGQSGPRIYVAEAGSNTVTAINAGNNSIITSSRVRATPCDLVMDPTSSRLYVSTAIGIQIVDAASGIAQGLIPLPNETPCFTRIALNPNPSSPRLYAPTSTGLNVIDVASQSVLRVIPTLGSGVAVHPNGSRYYLTALAGTSSEIHIFDAASDTLVGSVAYPAIENVWGMAIHPTNLQLYLASVGGLVIVDTTTNTVAAGPIPLPEPVQNLAFNGDGTRLYATTTTDQVLVIDVTSSAHPVVAAIPVGSTPTDMAFNAAGNRLYVSTLASNAISVIDTGSNAEVGVIPVGLSPGALVFRP